MNKAVKALCISSAVLLPGTVDAYSIHTVVSDDCHERITLEALSRVRSQHGVARPIEPEGEDEALVRDLPVDVDTDLVGATLILANRDIDLGGHDTNALDELAPLHGAPGNQDEHCLRAPGHDEPDGTQQAIAACRSFIRSKVERAIDGLGPDGRVDPSHRTTLEAVLDVRGPVDAPLPTFYVEMGRALHTFQDAFSHQWRTAGHRRVTTVLNYVEVVNESYEEAEDGPPHSSQLDECVDLDAFRAERLEVVKGASVELMAAALLPAQDDQERLARVDAVLDDYFQVEPGCTAANGWCDAPEQRYRDDTGCTCSSAVGSSGGGLGALLFAGLLGFAARRRRRARWAVLVPACAVALFARHAHAQEGVQGDMPGTEGDALSPAELDPVDVSPDSEDRAEPFPLGVHLAAGGSLENEAVAVSLGLRYRLSENFLVGLDGEYNPWYSRTTQEFRSGTTNAYGTLIGRLPMDFEPVNIRTTLQLGISRMNFDLYGVPKGTVGPYVGFNLLGVDVELSRSVYLVIDPAHIAIPVPQTEGTPFSYAQYRITLGLQIGG